MLARKQAVQHHYRQLTTVCEQPAASFCIQQQHTYTHSALYLFSSPPLASIAFVCPPFPSPLHPLLSFIPLLLPLPPLLRSLTTPPTPLSASPPLPSPPVPSPPPTHTQVVGAKACNLAKLRQKLPDWILVPRSVALPFGTFEAVLSDPANAAVAAELQQLQRQLTGATKQGKSSSNGKSATAGSNGSNGKSSNGVSAATAAQQQLSPVALLSRARELVTGQLKAPEGMQKVWWGLAGSAMNECVKAGCSSVLNDSEEMDVVS